MAKRKPEPIPEQPTPFYASSGSRPAIKYRQDLRALARQPCRRKRKADRNKPNCDCAPCQCRRLVLTGTV